MDSKHQAKQEVQECYAKYMKHVGNKKKYSNSNSNVNSSNSNVCFLCGNEGHYGSPTSCYASKHVRKNYFN